MNKTNFLNLFGTNKTVSVLILIIIITVVILTIRQYTGANTDRICSRSVESETSCSNGSWSGWNVISEETESGITTTIKERTYTGTRGVQRTLQFETSFHNYSCSIGGENVTLISEVATCQVVETMVAKSGAGDGGGVGGGGGGVGSGGGGSGFSPQDIGGLEPAITTNEFTAPTTMTVIESVTLRAIDVDFMCSLNKENWMDCEKEIKVAKRTTPIYLKSFVEKATSWDWFIENNDIKPLAEGQSIGVFQNPKLEIVKMNLEYGSGNKFIKEVTLNVEGKDRFGLSASGSVTKTLNITVADLKYIEI